MLVRGVGLRKSYRGVNGAPIPVLNGVDLEVKPGEFVAVIGPSGSGKSTLLNLLGLLEPTDAGEVWFDGERVSHGSRRSQCRVRGTSIGFVFQSFLLIEKLTALENVLLAARYVGQDRQAAQAQAIALLERLEVGHRRGHYPSQLSGGEQQRVAYCRAVLNNPPFLLADEPTGSVDDQHAQAILSEIRGRVRERGTSVLLVTHRPEFSEEADRTLRLYGGRIESA
ncbi:MAG TPA: ABC transporter ATP-binding protein [Candidatus Methylomirabilis sp.]|nr:ABC transporter ATP-binding protein [Candidatus Methylomirabilis sp.]